MDTDKIINGDGNYEYLTRSVAIVTLLYERGILKELIQTGRITAEEIEERLVLIRSRFEMAAAREEEDGEDGTGDEFEEDGEGPG